MTNRIDGRIDRDTDRQTANAAFPQPSEPVSPLADVKTEADNASVFVHPYSPPTSSRLTPRDHSIITVVGRFRMASASQIGRLFFTDGSPASREVRKCRVLRRLTKWGEIARLPRAVGGGMGGSGEYIYMPPSARSRIANPHTLDITELYVQLATTNELELLEFDPEPYSHEYLGKVELKPDAYIRVRSGEEVSQYWLEVDRSTEWRSQLHKKLRRYVVGYHIWTKPTFPQILFICHDDQRQRLIQGVINRQEVPALFKVVLFNDFLREINSID